MRSRTLRYTPKGSRSEAILMVSKIKGLTAKGRFTEIAITGAEFILARESLHTLETRINQDS